MSLFGKPKGKKYHTRTIEVNTYEYDDRRLVVEGCLTDHRLQEFHLAKGEKRSPGILHEMIIHLLVNKTTLEIEDLHAEMPNAPDKECLKTINSMESAKGLKIASGFRSKIKMLVGNGKGCQHLANLLTSMGSSAVQGYAAYKQQESPRIISNMSNMINMVVNSCWTWRKEGPLFSHIKERIKAEQSG